MSGSGRARAASLVALLLLGLVACGSGPASSPTPVASDASPDPSGGVPGPTFTVDPQLCEAMRNLATAVASVKAVKLKTSTRDDLGVAFDNVGVAMDDIQRFAPDALIAQVRTLSYAVTDLGLSVEDYRTTDHPDQAAPAIDRKGVTVEKVLRSLHAATSCPA